MGERDRLLGVGDQVFFADRAVAWSVARIFGKDHAQAQWRERSGVEGAVTGMPGVAVKHDGGAAHGANRLRHEAAKVLRRRPGAQPFGNHVPDSGLLREVEQSVLEHGDPRQGDQAGNGQARRHRGEFHRRERAPAAALDCDRSSLRGALRIL